MRAWFAAIFFLSFTLSAQQNQFKAGYFALPPHTENSVGHSGPAIHYFNKIAALMQVEVQYQQLPLSRLLKQLENNQLDAVLLLAQNPDRQQRFVYPQQPFLITQGALAVRTEIQTDASSFLSNPRYSIAIWQQGYQSSQLQNFAGRFVGLSGEHIGARAAEMLEKDRVDAFYEPDIYALRHSLEHHGYAAHFYILELPQDQVPLYTVF